MPRPQIYRALNEGLHRFHDGEPFSAHEAWEEAWKVLEGPERALAQALVQIAAARIKRAENNALGVEKLLDKARLNLEGVTESAMLGLDVEGLRGSLEGLSGLPDDADLTRLLPPAVHEAGIVYLHGFASGPGSAKARLIGGTLEAEGWPVRIPDLNEDRFEQLTVSRALALVRRNLFDRTLIIGSSMGGYLATLMAQDDPRVVGLVLMAPAFDLAERLEARYDAEGTWQKNGHIVVDHYAYGTPSAIAYDFILDARGHPSRPRIPAPAYVITGQRDEVVPVELVTAVTKASDPAVRFEIVDDDHGLIASANKPLEAARDLARTLLRVSE